MSTYQAVVDQQAGKPADLDSTTLSGGAMLGIVLVGVVAIVLFSMAAEKKPWVMPGLFLLVFVVWPVGSMLLS